MNGKHTFYTSLAELGISKGKESIDQIARAMVDNSSLFYPVNVELGSANIYPTSYGMITMRRADYSRISIEYATESNAAIWLGKYYMSNTPTWGGWIKAFPSEPPQEFALPFASGVTNNYKSTYYKNQFGEVTVIAALHHATALPAVVATLPAGYRPALDLGFPAVLRNSSGNVAWTVRVGANGQISIKGDFGVATELYFFASFPATL